MSFALPPQMLDGDPMSPEQLAAISDLQGAIREAFGTVPAPEVMPMLCRQVALQLAAEDSWYHAHVEDCSSAGWSQETVLSMFRAKLQQVGIPVNRPE